MAVSMYTPTNSAKIFLFLHILFSIYCLYIFWWWPSDRCEEIPHCNCDLHLSTNEWGHYFNKGSNSHVNASEVVWGIIVIPQLVSHWEGFRKTVSSHGHKCTRKNHTEEGLCNRNARQIIIHKNQVQRKFFRGASGKPAWLPMSERGRGGLNYWG